VDGASVPGISDSRELLAYPKDLLSSPLSVTSATFRFHPGDPAALAASAATGSTVTGAPVASGGSFAALVRWRLTPLVVALSLALAFLFGCLHALGPGHGKTITAAYLVGAGARVRHAMTVGVVVLTGSISAHRIGYGLGMIAAFSLGLATALILIGLLALRARSLVAAHLRGRWAALVPLGSALVIVGFGLFFAARGATQLA